MFTDTHCHLSDERLLSAEEVEKRYVEEGVDLVINIGYDLPSSIKVIEQSESIKSSYYAIGIHPDSPEQVTDTTLSFFEESAKDEKCVAIGEIGLDYHYEGYNERLQKSAFLRQMELAKTLKLPISIHSRDCTEDMVKLLKENKSYLTYGGVMHCYSGSVETAKILLDLGMYISFAGTLTFKNARQLPEVCAFCPEDRILSETDSPYLTPHPYRGNLNEPRFVKYVVEKMASIRDKSVTETAEIIRKNTKRLFYKIK